MDASEIGSESQIHEQPPVSEPPVAPEPVIETEPPSATDRLRAFEDEHLGPDAPRIGGELERGHGSLFQRMPADKQKAHAAIEKIVVTEQKLSDARAAVVTAEAEHEAAIKAADRAVEFED